MAQTKNVNMTPNDTLPRLRLSQYDVGRELAFKLCDGALSYTVPTGATVKLMGTKPSGFGFTESCTVSGNTASISTTAGMTDEWGAVVCELVVEKSGVRLGSTNLLLVVEKSPHPEGTTDGSQETVIPTLTLLVERVETAASSILDMTVEAETLAAGSDATYSYDEETNTATFGIPRGADGSLASGVLAPTYSTSGTYAVGDYVYYSGNLYRCTTAITTAESWTSGHWTQVALAPEVSDLKSDFEQSIEYPENTAFASRIQNDTQYVSFDDCKLGLIKYTSLVPYNNTKFISSSGSDSYAFRNPYYGFTFGLDNVNTEAYRLKGGMPQGLVNETLLIEETLTKNQETAFDFYTVNQPKGTVILFKIPKTTETGLFTPSVNHFTEDCLELNDIQDTFARYSIRGSKSDITPSVTKLTGKLVSTTNGTLSDNASYDTYYFKCPVSRMSVTCTNAFRCVITTKDPTLITINGFLSSVVYSYESGRVDTFDVELGQYVVFSLSHATQPNIDLKTDYVKTFSLPTLRLAYGQKNGFYRIEKSGSATYLYVFCVSGEKVVGWELHNAPSSGINSNTWQIGHIMGYDFDGRSVSNGVELVAGGEFELAFKEYGASDYCGGNNHGDENQVDFTLVIDGKTIDLSNVDSDYHAFDRIDAIEHALINRCDTPDEDILKHQKIWVFENGTVKVRQTLEFLEALNCDFLCCMFAANRSYFTHGVRQGRVGTEVMTSSSFPDVQTDGNEMAYVMYGTNASAKITARTCEHSPTASLWINPASTINKLYYNFFHRIPNTSVAQGTALWWESEYDVAYN